MGTGESVSHNYSGSRVTGNHIPLASAMAGNFVSLNSRFQCPQPYVGGTLVPVIVPSDGIWSKVFE